MEAQLLQSASVATYIKLDPRTKLFLMLVISTVMISGEIEGNAAYSRLVLALVPVVLLLTGGRMKSAAVYATLFVLAWCAETFLLYSTTGMLNIFIVMLSGLVTRFFPGLVMGAYLMLSTRVSEFMAAMERMHVSQKIVIPMSVMFRFFPTVVEESRSINDAMRIRGLGVRRIGNNPMALLEYRLVPLLMSVVKIGDELSASALTRGLGGPVKRTNVCRIGFGLWDAVFFIVVLAALIFYLFC